MGNDRGRTAHRWAAAGLGWVLLLGPGGVGPAWSVHSSLSSGSAKTGGPVTTISAATLERGRWVVDVHYEAQDFDTFSHAELVGFAERDREVHNADSLREVIADVSYGVTDDLSVHLSLPHVTRTGIEESEPPDEVHGHGDARGLGDLTLHVHHRVLRAEAAGLEGALLYGVKMPTGRTTAEDDHGVRFEAEFQAGSGSWDPFAGLSVTKTLGAAAVHASTAYALVTEGAQDTDLGDRWSYNLALTYRLGARWPLDLILEANGLWRQREKVGGRSDPDSGGHLLLLSPGVRLGLFDRVSFYGALGVPVAQDLNGDQNEVELRSVAGASLSW